jgi:hypothetical protein
MFHISYVLLPSSFETLLRVLHYFPFLISVFIYLQFRRKEYFLMKSPETNNIKDIHVDFPGTGVHGKSKKNTYFNVDKM